MAELDRHVVGQAAAKRALAIALRNRLRRQKLPPDIAAEITPKNILLIGPTGVGKTELARRLARLCASPFLKVEASKFTEVGYVGRDVETIVRDLLEGAIAMVRREREAEVRVEPPRRAEERLLDLLLPVAEARPVARPPPRERGPPARGTAFHPRQAARTAPRGRSLDDALRRGRGGRGPAPPPSRSSAAQGGEDLEGQLRDMLPGLFGSRKTPRARLTVAEAREVLLKEEQARLVDRAAVVREAIARVEARAIVFLDEIDKIAGRERGTGPDVSREGVQRDLLPLVEGTTVNTKHGPVRTDHILFIAAGAFHVSKPSDLIPELQGRFPIRVELTALTEADLVRILTEPKNALSAQYRALLGTDGVDLVFTDEAIRELAAIRHAGRTSRPRTSARAGSPPCSRRSSKR